METCQLTPQQKREGASTSTSLSPIKMRRPSLSLSQQDSDIKSTLTSNPTDGYHYLYRVDQVILISMRTLHNRINVHMYCKLKSGQMDHCSCDTALMTSQHLLQDCTLHVVVR